MSANMQRVTIADGLELQAIHAQLPKGWEQATGVWWPLLLPDGEYYVRGNQLVTLEEYSRNLALALGAA